MVIGTGSEIGSMYVTLTANDKDLTIKLSNVKNKLDNLGRETKSVNTDFTRFAKTAALVSAGLAAVGISAAAITALATHSPALAGAMAAIAINTFNLGQILGQELVPIFDKIGQELIPAIGIAIKNLEPQIKWFVDTASEGVSDLAKLITGKFNEIPDAIPKTAMGLTFAAAGFAMTGTFMGALMGFGLGYAIEKSLRPNITQEQSDEYERTGTYSPYLYGNLDQTDRAVQKFQEAALADYSNMTFWQKVKNELSFFPNALDVGFNLLMDSINNIINNWEKSGTDYATQNGLPRGTPTP